MASRAIVQKVVIAMMPVQPGLERMNQPYVAESASTCKALSVASLLPALEPYTKVPAKWPTLCSDANANATAAILA